MIHHRLSSRRRCCRHQYDPVMLEELRKLCSVFSPRKIESHQPVCLVLYGTIHRHLPLLGRGQTKTVKFEVKKRNMLNVNVTTCLNTQCWQRVMIAQDTRSISLFRAL